MRQIRSRLAVIIVMLAVCFCLDNSILAQTPADDPGGPGSSSGGGGLGGDGSPIVPFDGGMSLILLASGVGYGYKKLKGQVYKSLHWVNKQLEQQEKID